MNKKEKNYPGNAIANLSFADQYLNVVENLFQQTIKQGNKHLIIFDHPVDWEEYNNKTSASDFNIIIPTLFCLYQGIELILKALLLLNKVDPPTGKSGHKLSLLCQTVSSQPEIPEEIKKSLSYFLKPRNESRDFLNFLNTNDKTLDNIAEILRYPNTKDFDKIHNYINIKYKEEKIIPYIENILKNCHELRIKVIAYSREKAP